MTLNEVSYYFHFHFVRLSFDHLLTRTEHIKVPNKLMRRNATKLAENAAKRFPVPAKEDDPYYITSAAAGKFNFESAKEQRRPLTADRTDRTSSSTSKRQARRADKIAAQEECNNALKTQLDKTSKVSAPESKSRSVSKPAAPKGDSRNKVGFIYSDRPTHN
jgi:hypothetical protein